MNRPLTIKDGNVIQVKYFNSSSDEYWKYPRTRLEICLEEMNKFLNNNDIIDIEVVNQFGSSIESSTFAKASRTYSKDPIFLVYYQVQKLLIDTPSKEEANK